MLEDEMLTAIDIEEHNKRIERNDFAFERDSIHEKSSDWYFIFPQLIKELILQLCRFGLCHNFDCMQVEK